MLDSTLSYDEYYSIAYAEHTIMNPLTLPTVREIGRRCGLKAGSRIVDIGSGKGYVCHEYAKEFEAHSVQIDKSPQWIAEATRLFADAGLLDYTELIEDDVKNIDLKPAEFDLAICLGNTPIFGGFERTVTRLLNTLRPGGHLLIGEAIVPEEVPAAYNEYLDELEWRIHTGRELFTIVEENEAEIVYFRRSTDQEWDDYLSLQWHSLLNFLRDNPDHPHYEEILDWLKDEQEQHLRFGIHYLDWGVFLIRSAV
ncbi:MAG: hypothetical protein CL946_10415 [Ectothiorhodospiraceae bacterium]|nr:hypothetical protein [Ectothiorhodospiraceae bacterium]